MSLQPIDRHIGIIYKKAVYTAYRKEMTKRLRRYLTNQRESNLIPSALRAMSAKDKRILIAMSISETHQHMCSSGSLKLKRAFIATGTWMPVAHLINNNIEEPEEDGEVKVQHFDDYVYRQRVNRETVQVRMDDIEEEKRERLTVERRQKNLVRLFRWSRDVTYSSWIDKGSTILPCVKRRLLIKTETCS